MRWRIAACAATLLIGLGIAGLVSAEESSSWWPRWLTSATAKSDKKDSAKSSDMPPMVSPARRARQAKADLERRQEVCLKLRELALANGDDETLRKIEHLEQRAYDLYMAATNFRSAPLAEASTKKGGR